MKKILSLIGILAAAAPAWAAAKDGAEKSSRAASNRWVTTFSMAAGCDSRRAGEMESYRIGRSNGRAPATA